MDEPPVSPPPQVIRRHALSTRLWHWTNAVCIFVLLGSGLMIFNAHPHLYWGQYGANFDHPWLSLPRWPGWLTIPSTYNLALGRRWHLFFALVFAFGLLAFMIVSLLNRHFQRDLTFRRRELAPRHLWEDLKDHLAFRFHDPDDPGRYNTLQKASYVATIFVLIPLMILTGLAMSPGMNAAWPWLIDLFGGRQSARSIHFIAAGLIALFTVVHLTLVILAGVGNELRSMITGRWKVPEE
ncbi:cytochrome b/b6 domain-containing protein [Sphingomonas cannabina]|uniref:cytochrome b/b6 domain-containing protein n=1 Tax=Sphingomonas cannabina TaxID=2899123 RepID=UPI001F3702A1|nr:cytochrome b/b6 domain-containing protein [Sphingomonas cannabina]UIJ45296.1 cytochrome b/b6 domain-containing protein [Sphingomonas cannabina]